MKKMLIFAVVGMMMAWGVFAHETWTDPKTGLTWTYQVMGNGGVSVGGGSNVSQAIPRSMSGVVVIPPKIDGKDVTGIGAYAFEYCDGLTSVTIPEGVESIGASAFDYCSGLTSFIVEKDNLNYKSENGLLLTKDGKKLVSGVNGDVTIPSSVTSIGKSAFWGRTGLTGVTITEGVKSIGSFAFCDCSGLTSVSIPSSVTDIWDWAFDNCSGLTSFIVEKDNPNYKSENGLLLTKDGKTIVAGVNGKVTIPSSVTSIGYCAFYGYTGLISVTIPSSVTSIGMSAFSCCRGLTSVTIPSSVTNIGEWAFSNCGGLTSVSIPEGVTEIGASTFYCCSGLMSVTIPEGVVSIGEDAFGSCSGLTSVTIPSSVTSIGDGAFYWCSGLTSVTIPEGVVSIGEAAFSKCRALTSFSVEEGNQNYKSEKGLLLTKDGKTLVAGVNKRNVTIPPSVTSIGYQAFRDCSVTSVTIPSSVTSIGEAAFYECYGLASVHVEKGDTERVRRMLDESGYDTDNLIFLQGVLIAGAKSEIVVEPIGYMATGLPKGLSYDVKKGKITGTVKTEGEYEVTFGRMNSCWDPLVVTFVVRKENEPTIECSALEDGEFTAGVSGAEGAIPLEIEAESGVKSLTAKGLPTGMKVVQDKVTKGWFIQGGATKTGTFNVALTLTTVAGTKVEKKYEITVSPLHEMAVGTFNGFVTDGEDHVGTLQVTTTDSGKITSKVVMAKGTFSFTGTAWDSAELDVYSVTLKTKKGDELSLSVDTSMGWNERQMSGIFAESGKDGLEVFAQRVAFGKQWYFDAEGNESEGWTFSYAADTKKAALTVTWNADGKTSVAGKLGSLKVSASGYCDVSGITEGAVMADFAPVVTVNKAKKILSIKTNLWLDRENDHEAIGSARLIE